MAIHEHDRVGHNILRENVVYWPTSEIIFITYAIDSMLNINETLLEKFEAICSEMNFIYDIKVYFHGFFEDDGHKILRYGCPDTSVFEGVVHDPKSLELLRNEISKSSSSDIFGEWINSYINAIHDGVNTSNMKPNKITNLVFWLRKINHNLPSESELGCPTL